jgi:hypothetical protein
MTDGWAWVVVGYALTAIVWAGYVWWSGRGADR